MILSNCHLYKTERFLIRRELSGHLYNNIFLHKEIDPFKSSSAKFLTTRKLGRLLYKFLQKENNLL